jgi:3-methyl-2-oxobutanoate hydroxymethyltransferase
VSALGGYRAQGKTANRASRIAEEALALQAAGCFAIVFEAIPAEVTSVLMPRMTVPVIGIGAGLATDGQVLVYHDLLGIFGGHAARFVKRYANVREEMVRGLREYAAEVRSGRYPGPEHCYSVDPEELDTFRRYLDQETLAGESWDWSATEI